MLSELPIEQENIDAFRTSLKATGDATIERVGALGEIIFLDTKVFDESYMQFCDEFANNWLAYPKRARDEMRQRRAALFPYLRMPLFHGGVSYDGLFLNVFVLKSSGRVLCCEQDDR